MAETLSLFVHGHVDGDPVDGYPVRRTLSVDVSRSFAFELAPDAAAFEPLSTDDLSKVQALILFVRGSDLVVRLEAQTAEEFPIEDGGMLLLWDVELSSAADFRIQLRNTGTENARIMGMVAGAKL